MHWYEDDALWSDFAPTMFPAARAESAAALVASSPCWTSHRARESWTCAAGRVSSWCRWRSAGTR